MKTKLLLLLLLFSLTISAQNLVPNGDFETWSSSSQPDDWYRSFNGYVSKSSTPQNGLSSTRLKITGATNFINSKTFAVKSNKTYRVSLYHRGGAPGDFSSIELSLYHQPGTFKEKFQQITDQTFSDIQWRKLEFEYTSKVDENIEVDIWVTGKAQAEILLDNVSVVLINEPSSQYTLIPDINFEKKLIALNLDAGVPDGKVLTTSIATQTNLDISSSFIANLTGIQDFTSLTSLDFSYNNITSVDLSKNTILTTLNCSAIYPEGLLDLDVSKNVLLKTLLCSGNKITNLDLSKNILLTTLICNRSNELLTINLKNGNNKNMIVDNIQFPNPSLKCVQVDDVDYSNANWADSKMENTIYSTTCSTLGLEDAAFNKAVLYPNPTKGEVNINNIALEKATVYNSLGQLVKTFILNSGDTNNTINLSGLPKGVYYVYLINGDAASAKKIIVE
ncbi:T9SS type A sorting domain-containing protein [[Flexibacter] sp. ATCC 35103]|uniref:T9SS type A sorting domain-containing protein n=1 Tax=[Flexibacter] sp. ATCC 35103 TaxID=1937528 RepID=UPI0009C82E98|nr:T9SS type A sorting domain-containing protein [[Flexibacter] sp. ATCC 35103]OMQ12193.1 hypothetical protein BXU01_04755 [[Flexibacter] sp. ATCC 35103]